MSPKAKPGAKGKAAPARKAAAKAVAEPAPPPPEEDSPGTFSLQGWGGYNERFNGFYDLDGRTINGRPAFRHTNTVGVGAGADWCRMWWASGAWRIGHFAFVDSDQMLCCAFVRSDAAHPSEIPSSAMWFEHPGRQAGQDFSRDERQFSQHPGVTVRGSASAPAAPRTAEAAIPRTITVSNARTHEGHGHWPNDTWHLQGESCGKPQWCRQGNRADSIKWDGRRWTLNGMQPKCYFQNVQDTPLPPKSGWQTAEMEVSSMPTLSYGSGGASQPASQPVGTCTLQGWAGYNKRFNGPYDPIDRRVNERPVFRHTTADWCRIWWAGGAWRIGHFMFLEKDQMLCCAFVRSDAAHPSEIPSSATWFQHPGREAGKDFSRDETQFSQHPGVMVRGSPAAPAVPRMAEAVAVEQRSITLKESARLSALAASATVVRADDEDPYWEQNPSGEPFNGKWVACDFECSAEIESGFQDFMSHGGDPRRDLESPEVRDGIVDCSLLYLRHKRTERPLRRVLRGEVTHPPCDSAHPWYKDKLQKVDNLGGEGDWLTSEFFFKGFQMAVLRDGGEIDFNAEDFFSLHFSNDFRQARPKLERRGGVLYEVPAGWKRFALSVKDKYADGNDWMCMDGRPGEWAVAYHGTKFDAVPKIIRDGFRVGIRHGPAACNLKDSRTGQAIQEGICCTPNLTVVECFANGEETDTGRPPITIDDHTLFFALQCRVRPGAIRRPNNTVYTRTTNDEETMGVKGVFEWIIGHPADIRPYAVLVRDRATCPNHRNLHILGREFAGMRPSPDAYSHVPGKISEAAQTEAEEAQVRVMDRSVMPRLAPHEARMG